MGNPGSIDTAANEMDAKANQRQFGAKIGLSISGITREGFVFIRFADAQGVKTWQKYAPGRQYNREMAAMAALFRLRERFTKNKLND